MDVKGFYQAIGGNYEAALRVMMNDAFVERMLGKFFANNAYGDIVSSYENKDFQAVFNSSHAFKGVTGNLSLTPLFEIADTITEATRSLQAVDLDKEIEELKKRYSFVEQAYLGHKN